MTDRSNTSQTAPRERERPFGADGPGLERRVRDPAWLARAASVGLCLASLGFVALVVAGFAIDGQLAIVTRPLPLRVATALPPLIAALALGTGTGTVAAWREGYWTRAARIHQTILAVFGLLFVWQLFVLGFLP